MLSQVRLSAVRQSTSGLLGMWTLTGRRLFASDAVTGGGAAAKPSVPATYAFDTPNLSAENLDRVQAISSSIIHENKRTIDLINIFRDISKERDQLNHDPLDLGATVDDGNVASTTTKVVEPKIVDGRSYATGRRKTSVARVWLKKGSGKVTVNNEPLFTYFASDFQRSLAIYPLSATDQLGNYDILCTVNGGGLSGQAGAIRLGVSRALQNFQPELHKDLRVEGLLTRDSRMVERKKPGQKKARKKFQWVKR